jgi:hypothetical protein
VSQLSSQKEVLASMLLLIWTDITGLINEGRSNEMKWQLVDPSEHRKCTGGSSSKLLEHLASDDHEGTLNKEFSSRERQNNPTTFQICKHEIAASQPTNQKTAQKCGHQFHSACLSYKSRVWGYDCPPWEELREISRARRELHEETFEAVLVCVMLLSKFFCWALGMR